MSDPKEADLLSESDPIHTTILESIPVGVAVLAGTDLVCEYANRAFEDLSPWRTVLHRPLVEAYPEEAARVLPILRRVLETGDPLQVEDLPLEVARRPGGPVELRYFTATLRRAPRHGRPPAIVATVLETTGRVRSLARADLLSSVAAELASCDDLDTALHIAVSGGAVLVGAEDGCVALLSAGGDRLTFAFEMRRRGRVGAGDDVADMPCARSSMEVARAAFLPRAAAAGAEARWMDRIGIGGAIVAPLVHERRRLGVLFFDLPAGRTSDASDLALAEAIAAHCTLAVERARAFEAEREARARAEKAEERSLRAVAAQERMAAIVGHDLRTPLAAVSLTAHNLAALGGLTERQAVLVARIQSSVRRMDRIIRDLLDATRARNGMGIRVFPTPARLDEICARAAAELQQAHASTRIELSSCGDTSGQWDAARLEQVMSNLVANAVRHAAPGTPVRVSARAEEGEVVVDVANAGDPIPPEVLPSIFDPFSSGDASGAGLGLGLYIVREIVSAHGGTVTVRSRGDEGTVFSVRLPRHA